MFKPHNTTARNKNLHIRDLPDKLNSLIIQPTLLFFCRSKKRFHIFTEQNIHVTIHKSVVFKVNDHTHAFLYKTKIRSSHDTVFFF